MTATTADQHVLRRGQLRVKASGSFSSRWKLRSVALTEKAIVTPDYKIPLDHITKVERVDLTPYCLLLEASPNKRWHLSFQNDGELYDWQEDVYSRCPRIGGGNPFGFIHNVHVGFEPHSGNFTGLPSQWSESLGITDPKLNAAFHQKSKSKSQPTPPLQGTPTLSYSPAMARSSSSSSAGSSKLPASPISPAGYRRVNTSPPPAVLEGQLAYRKQSFFAWKWNSRWLVLGPKTLTISKSKGAKSSSITLNLRDIAAIERSERRPFCLVVQLKSGKRYFLSFEGDSQLYSWQEAMYSRSPLAGISGPTGFVHNMHMGIDSRTGEFTGIPEQWRSVLLNIPQ